MCYICFVTPANIISLTKNLQQLFTTFFINTCVLLFYFQTEINATQTVQDCVCWFKPNNYNRIYLYDFKENFSRKITWFILRNTESPMKTYRISFSSFFYFCFILRLIFFHAGPMPRSKCELNYTHAEQTLRGSRELKTDLCCEPCGIVFLFYSNPFLSYTWTFVLLNIAIEILIFLHVLHNIIYSCVINVFQFNIF